MPPLEHIIVQTCRFWTCDSVIVSFHQAQFPTCGTTLFVFILELDGNMAYLWVMMHLRSTCTRGARATYIYLSLSTAYMSYLFTLSYLRKHFALGCSLSTLLTSGLWTNVYILERNLAPDSLGSDECTDLQILSWDTFHLLFFVLLVIYNFG